VHIGVRMRYNVIRSVIVFRRVDDIVCMSHLYRCTLLCMTAVGNVDHVAWQSVDVLDVEMS
jgi:hypothetical protein